MNESCKNCIWAERADEIYLFCDEQGLFVHNDTEPCKYFQTVDNPPESEEEE